MNAQIEYPFNPDFDGNELKKDPFNNKAFRIRMLKKARKPHRVKLEYRNDIGIDYSNVLE